MYKWCGDDGKLASGECCPLVGGKMDLHNEPQPEPTVPYGTVPCQRVPNTTQQHKITHVIGLLKSRAVCIGKLFALFL